VMTSFPEPCIGVVHGEWSYPAECFPLNCFKIDNKKTNSVRIPPRGQHKRWTLTLLVSATQAKDSDLLKDVSFVAFVVTCCVIVRLYSHELHPFR
jgi:hypothetical protein